VRILVAEDDRDIADLIAHYLRRQGWEPHVVAAGDEAVAYHKTAAALSNFSKTGLTDIEDIVPCIRFMVSDGWWMTGQTILVNGGYTTK